MPSVTLRIVAQLGQRGHGDAPRRAFYKRKHFANADRQAYKTDCFGAGETPNEQRIDKRAELPDPDGTGIAQAVAEHLPGQGAIPVQPGAQPGGMVRERAESEV